MKKAVVLLLLFFLSGCSGTTDEMEAGLKLRSELLQSTGCSFAAEITVDYGDQLHMFSMDCRSDSDGGISFTVTEPDTISGITGKLTDEVGELIFDETALYFELLAEEQLSPICAPWILMKTLRNGYLTSACREEGNLRLSIDDSFEEDPLCLDVWLNSENLPERAEILYDGRKILSVSLKKFEIL